MTDGVPSPSHAPGALLARKLMVFYLHKLSVESNL